MNYFWCVQKLQVLAQSTYSRWFNQFEFPNEEGLPYKSNGGKFEYNEEFKREIPVGWEAKKLSTFIKYSKNGDWGSETPTTTDSIKVNCFRGADFPCITDNFIMTAPVRFIKNSSINRILEDGDLVTEISGGSPTQSTGRIGYINKEFLSRTNNKMTCSNFCKAFTPINKTYQFWLYHTWKAYYENDIMFNYESKTTGIKNLMFDEFINNVSVPCPCDSIMTQFQTICESYYATIQTFLKQNQKLFNLREFLLPLLINGQLEV